MDRLRTIRLTEQELYEITRDICQEVTAMDACRYKAKLMFEVSRTYNLLIQMEKPKSSLYKKHTNRLMFFALISFVALSGKMIIENFMGNH